MWILFTLSAAFFQTIRTSLQKHLSKELPSDIVTAIRSGFALPFVYAYVGILMWINFQMPQFSMLFFVYAFLTAFFQITATFCMVELFKRRQFLVGILYAKTEGLQIALLGVILFQDNLSLWGWVSVIFSVIGIVFLSLKNAQLPAAIPHSKSQKDQLILGLLSGFGFALTSLCARYGSLSLSIEPLHGAAVMLAVVLTLQTLFLSSWIALRYPERFALLRPHFKLSIAVGLTSLLGSIGWFSAFALATAAYVKTLGQIEIFFSMLVTRHIFKETLSWKEYVGMSCILLSVVLLVLV